MSWLVLGIGIAGIVQSHVLSIMLVLLPGLPLFIVASLVGIKRYGVQRLKSILVDIVKAFILSVCLCLWFIVPFLDYYTTEELFVKQVETYTSDHVLEPFQLLAFDWSFAGRSIPFVDGITTDMPTYIGWGLLVSLPGTAVFFIAVNQDNAKFKGNAVIIITLIIVALVLMFMCTYLFPWHLAKEQGFLSSIISKLAVIQFPWRLIGEISFLLVIVLCFLFSKQNPLANHFIIISSTLALIGSGLAISSFTQESMYLEEETYASITNHSGSFLMGGEYIPIDAAPVVKFEQNHLNGPNPSDPDTVEIDSWIRFSATRATIVVSNSDDAEASIQLPMFYYDNWKLNTLQGGNVESGAHLESMEGNLSLVIPPGMSQSFEIVYEKPRTWAISEIASIASVIAIALYFIIRFVLSRRRPATSENKIAAKHVTPHRRVKTRQ